MSLVTAVESQALFKIAVLKHITEQLPAEQWIWLRAQASAQLMGFSPTSTIDLESRPEQLLAEHLTVDDAYLNDVLQLYPSEVIDTIDGRPLHYSHKTGLYLWGQTEQSGFLSYWISFPSSRPGAFI